MHHSPFDTGAATRVAAVAETVPPACPVCQSSSVTTTARHPDENTYWRCGSCGEIWNIARRDARRPYSSWR
jgi:transposase-like protein